MLYRSSLAILSGGLIAIETFAVSAPLLTIASSVDGQEVLPWHTADQVDRPGDNNAPDSDEILAMSSVAVTGTVSLVQLVVGVAAIVRRRVEVVDDATVKFPSSAAS